MPVTISEQRSTRVRWTHSLQINIFTGATSSSKVSQSSTLVTKRLTKTWTVTPYWRTLLRSGAILPDRSYSQVEFELLPGLCQWVSFTNGNPNDTITTVTEPGFWFAYNNAGANIAGLDAQLRMKLLRKMRGNEFNVPVAVAEAGSAIGMVADRATDLVKILRDLRRGKIGGLLKAAGLSKASRPARAYKKEFGRNPSKAASNLWLEARYGWLPLMMDCQNAVHTVMDTVDREIDKCGTVRASVKAIAQQNTFNTAMGAGDSDNYRTVSDSRRGVWRFKPKSGYYPARFGILNPLTVAWEVVPLSFVGDWFLPISDYLASFDTKFRVDHSGGTYGQRKQTNSVRVAKLPTPVGTMRSAAGNAVSRHVFTERTAMTTMPDVSLGDVQIDPKLDYKRMITAVALLRQNLRF